MMYIPVPADTVYDILLVLPVSVPSFNVFPALLILIPVMSLSPFAVAVAVISPLVLEYVIFKLGILLASPVPKYSTYCFPVFSS